MASLDNLMAAFAGESQANRKYLAFAKKAEADGKPGIAKLFRAAAEAETVHAHAHLRVANGIRTTTDNLQEAINGEHHEFTSMYPEFVAEAKKEGHAAALRSFEYAMAVEKIHHAYYTKAAEAFAAGKDFPASRIFVCPVCGNTVLDAAPDKCAICGVLGSKFVEVA